MVQGGLVFDRVSEHEIDVRDTISNQQYRISSSEPIESHPTEFDSFPSPTTDALVLDAVDLRISGSYGVTFRDEDGDMYTRFGYDGGTHTVDEGTNFLELDTPVKSYLCIEGPFEYRHTSDEITLTVSQSAQTVLGARAWRCYPQETITVTDSIDDLREAISCFGEAMQTSSPERSFPTLRGHPPVIQLGEALDIPDSLSKSKSGTTITVPQTKSALLAVAPLAYYLLASVEFGEDFTIETVDGFRYRPATETLADAVHSVLTHCFSLDCIVRTEGLYPVDLKERHEFEARSEQKMDCATLYEQSFSKRTETYLQIEPDAVPKLTSKWPVTAFVEPNSRAVEALPQLVYELAHIRSEDLPRYTGDKARRHVLDAFSQGREQTRSTSLVFESREAFVDVPETTSQQTIWVGEGVPLNASIYLPEGYPTTPTTDENSVDEIKSGTTTKGLEIAVVCNETTMDQESFSIKNRFTTRDDIRIELSTYVQVCSEELRSILESGADYLHFIGHANSEGLECVDGMLDVATLEESNVETFFLNACQSLQQGKHLVERGSKGGIVTYSDVSDKYALETGGLLVQLLNAGFSIGSCLSVIKDTTPIGSQYTLVGNHAESLVQPPGGPPDLSRIKACDDCYELEITTYTVGTPQYTAGAMVWYPLDDVEEHSIVPSTVTARLSWEELTEHLSRTDAPVIFEGRLQSQAEFFETVGG